MELQKNKRITITDEGSNALKEMLKTGYIDISPEDKAAFDILFDLTMTLEYLHPTTASALLTPGRDTVIGRRSWGRPLLFDFYLRTLSTLMESGHVAYD